MSAKKINRALLQDILSKGEGVKTVSGEAIDWCISVAEQVAKNLAASGRKSPGGRLLAPKMDAGLMARHVEASGRIAAGGPLSVEAGYASAEVAREAGQTPGDWTDYNDWQVEFKKGKTTLRYEEWRKARGKPAANGGERA